MGAEENSAIVAVYLRLLEAELRGEPMVKARANEEVQRLTGRGRGSVEYKFQNISAVLRDYRHPFVRGYKPASNYQESLRDEVLHQLDSRDDLIDIAFDALTTPATTPTADLVWTDIPPPEVKMGASRAGGRVGKWDFVRLDAENRSLGRAGEVAVLARERSSLAKHGRTDLAARVEHVSVTQGDGLGFDVLSFATDGTEKFIEVKTTRLGAHWPMVISRNEVAFSQEEPERFTLYRVFGFSSASAGLYTLPGDIKQTCELSPATYQALPAQSCANTPSAV